MRSETILVIIVTYNAEKWTTDLLTPFITDRDGLEIVVIDNGSTDKTIQRIRELYPFVSIWERRHNLGFGQANNLGLEYALAFGYKGVFLLNQDASITPTAIRDLAQEASKDPSIGIISPIHRNRKGEIEHGFAQYIKKKETAPHTFQSCPFLNAALWYLPLTTISNIGLFSPLFRHYGEDLNYAHRVLSKGLRIGYLPSVQGYHYREEQHYTEEETYNRKILLKYAYHLAAYLNPLLPNNYKRYWEGPLKLWINSWQATLKGERNLANDLREKAKELRALKGEVALWRKAPLPNKEDLARVIERNHFAPVLLIVYNRPDHTKRLLSYFMSQPEALKTPIYILSDGAKERHTDKILVNETREICQAFAKRHPQCTIWEQPKNVGLAHNVTEGVSRLLEISEEVIVLEDDLKLSPYFLRWMNDQLDLHKEREEIAHLHAGTFYATEKLQNNHPLTFIGCWGWATWRDRWQRYWEPDGQKLLTQIEQKPSLKHLFDYKGYMKFTRMLRHQTEGKNNSWAIRWHAALLLAGKLSINAYPPLVSNDGFDGTGTHSKNDDRYQTAVAPYPIYATPLKRPIQESKSARQILLRYYQRTNNKVAKGYYKIKELLRQWRRHIEKKRP